LSADQTSLEHALAGQYRLDRLVGEGGMARVYLAHDLKHDRPVALKALRAELASVLGPDRFEREIHLAARLQHPHILTVLDSGIADGQLWFTMPFVEGESLRSRLQRERQLAVRDAVRIVREAAQALQYAHEHGVVHRDIKPDNILLTRDGSTLVADFGIARALGAAGGQPLTQTGMSVGTPAYMSPEQASGEREIDARTDIYALGVVLYELLAGEAPFTGPTAQAIIAKRFSQTAPSVRATRPNVPEAVDRAIQRALAVVPGDRFPSAEAMAAALDVEPSTPTPPVTEAAAASRPAPGPVRRHAVSLALLLGLAIGGGLLFAWRHNAGAPGAASAGADAALMRLAVLPFENLGDSSDAYFADGVTDAVRGKLTALPALQVIARGSSVQYRGTTKTPSQIAAELGVRYLLTGTVRWAKLPDGSSRVQVSPELVEVNPDGSAASRWQEPFDAPLTDVFKLQGEIAGRVLQSLRVALPGADQAQLAKAPTANPAAYDAYLRGQAAWSGGINTAPVPLRRALTQYQQAVALDSNFAAAWTGVALTSVFLYTNSTPTRELAQHAREAVERVAVLDPDGVDSHIAHARYTAFVELDNAKALAELEAVLPRTPNDVTLLGVVSILERSVGRWDDALQHAQAAYALDPRSAPRASGISQIHLWRRQPADARPLAERAYALVPSNPAYVQRLVMVALQEGNLAEARRFLATASEVPAPDLAAYMANVWDLGWALDDAGQQLALSLGPDAWDDDRATWGIVRCQLYALRGDQARSRIWADTAEHYVALQLREAPEDAQRHLFHGLGLAYLGHKPEALAEAERGLALAHARPEAISEPYFDEIAVRIHLLLGEKSQALDGLEALARKPFYMNGAWLRIDPTFAALRGDPRFENLVAGN
jgi:serine/threonine-protein kinase